MFKLRNNIIIYSTIVCVCSRESYSRVFEDNACRPYRSHVPRVIRGGNAVSATTHPEQRRTMLNCVLKFKFNPARKKKIKTKR